MTFNELCEDIAEVYKTTVKEAEDVLNKYGIDASNIEKGAKLLEGTQYDILKNADGSIRSFVKNEIVDVGSESSALNSNIAPDSRSIAIPFEDSEGTWTALEDGVGSGSAFDSASLSGIANGVGAAAALARMGYDVARIVDPKFAEKVDSFKPEWYKKISHFVNDPIDPLGSAYKQSGVSTVKLMPSEEGDKMYEMHQYLDEDALTYDVAYLQNEYGIFSSNTGDAGVTETTTIGGEKIDGGLPMTKPQLPPTTYENSSAIANSQYRYYYRPIAKIGGTDANNYPSNNMYWGMEQSEYNVGQDIPQFPDDDKVDFKAAAYKYTTTQDNVEHERIVVTSKDWSMNKGESGGNLNSRTAYFFTNNPTNFSGQSDVFSYTVGYGHQSQGSYTYDNKTVQYSVFDFQPSKTQSVTPNLKVKEFKDPIDYRKIAWIMQYSVAPASEPEPLPDGVSENETDKKLNLDGVDMNDFDAIKNALKKQFPEIWENSISQTVTQQDGTQKKYVYVEVPMVTVSTATDTEGKTATQYQVLNQTQTETGLKTATATQTQTESALQTETKPVVTTTTITGTPNQFSTGNGSSPVVTPPVGKASSLYAIYNPTIAQLNSFAAWLWSPNFVDQLLKLFSDPMQAIIGLHKVYATPIRGSNQNIKVGYLDSGVNSRTVAEQYTTIDCGSVSLTERYQSVFDYEPYTKVQLFLPFVGVVSLSTADVMRSSIRVKYTVDVLTGACLADVIVTRDGGSASLYQYGGEAAVTLPVSSGSYMGIVSSLASVAGGVAATVASGGAAAPMMVGAAGGLLNARTNVEHSGGFSGNVGAMGGKKPYLIISRPQTQLAGSYQDFVGVPANRTVTIGNCSGYVKFNSVHLEGLQATGNELQEIEDMLTDGVLI